MNPFMIRRYEPSTGDVTFLAYMFTYKKNKLKNFCSEFQK